MSSTVEFHTRISYEDQKDTKGLGEKFKFLVEGVLMIVQCAWQPFQLEPPATDLRKTHRRLNGVKSMIQYLLTDVIDEKLENTVLVSQVVEAAFVYQREGSTDRLRVWRTMRKMNALPFLLKHTSSQKKHGLLLGKDRLFRFADYYLSKEMCFSLQGDGLVVNKSFYETLSVLLSYGITERPNAFSHPTDELHDVEGEEISNHLLVDCFLMLVSHITYIGLQPASDNFYLWLSCIKLILRAIPMIHPNVLNQRIHYEKIECPMENLIPGVLSIIKSSQHLPELEYRLGAKVPRLDHLSKCKIRQVLHSNWALPHGIKELGLPVLLEEYLELKREFHGKS